jgi:hypothetical protein
MTATIVEAGVLAAGSRDDGRAALERLALIGPVVLLVGPGDDAGATMLGSADDPAGSQLTVVSWAGLSTQRPAGWQQHAGGGRTVDPEAVQLLTELRAAHKADWLIATEAILASGRACPGLGIVCVGPAADDADPMRPDHRAHSLLDAVHHVEAATAFA